MRTYDEAKIADAIVNILPAGIARVCSADRDTIRYALRAEGMKLRSIILSRRSLRRLIDDAARDVKIDYLQRDLLRSAATRAEFRYPRILRPGRAVRRPLTLLPIASAL